MSISEDLETVAFHFDFMSNEYAEEDHDDPEMKELCQSGNRLVSAIKHMEHVAWCRYTRNTIVTCDSDAEGAFKVYRDPIQR